MSTVIITVTFVVFCIGWFPAVESQFEFESSLLETPFKRKVLPSKIVNWLEDLAENRHGIQNFDDNINYGEDTTCREITFDLHIGGSVNHHPSIVAHKLCFNVRNSEQRTCLYKRLVCKQQYQEIYVLDRDNCHAEPKKHKRPSGCNCEVQF